MKTIKKKSALKTMKTNAILPLKLSSPSRATMILLPLSNRNGQKAKVGE